MIANPACSQLNRENRNFGDIDSARFGTGSQDESDNTSLRINPKPEKDGGDLPS